MFNNNALNFCLGVMDEDQRQNDGKQTKESLEETRDGEHQPLCISCVDNIFKVVSC